MTPTFPPSIMDLLPWDNMQEFVDDFTKGLQELIDAVSQDPDADNNRNLYIPHTYGTYTCLVRMSVNNVSNNYNDWVHSYGQQPYAGVCKVVINGTTPELIDMSVVGRLYAGDWYSIRTPEEIETLNTDMAAWFKPENFVFENLEQPKLIEMSADQVNPNNTRFLLHPAGYGGDKLKLYITDINGERTITPVRLWFYPIELRDDGESDYGRYSVVGGSAGTIDHITSGNFTVPYGTPIVSIFTSDTDAQDFVNKNGADNNYTLTYQGDGDEIKVYYGDNYIIYVVPDDDEISYDDIYNVTVDAVTDIDPSIHVPTYRENKYGPEPGPEPYEDDPWHGVDFSGALVGGAGAFAKVYYMTTTELANLRSWMASINVPEGFDPMAQIVSLSQVPVELSGDAPENVVFINSSAVYDPGVTSRAVDSGVATQQSMGLPIKYSLGNIDIARRMEERGEPYLDYDCQIELYLPLVGCFSLDTQAVMGRTITAEAVLDPLSGTLAAYAWVEKDGEKLPIAYGSTTIGVDLPVSAQQYSISRAALKQANAQLGTSILSSALTLIAAQASGGKGATSGAKTATGTNGLAAAGIREAGADYMKASQAGNIFGDFMQWGRTIRQLSYGNNTAISGSFGGSTAQWSYPFDAYVKIIRPRFEKPENYNHSQGVPCIKTMTIGECTGFIQCVGVDVSGITRATDLERQAIQAALCNGVYAGGGEE